MRNKKLAALMSSMLTFGMMGGYSLPAFAEEAKSVTQISAEGELDTECDTEAESETDTEINSAVFAGGDGSQEAPYLIETADQLQQMSQDLTASYRLTADIDLTDVDWVSVGNASMEDMAAGDLSGCFSGSFDGDGHVISNIACVPKKDGIAAGFFGCMTGSVSNAVFENVTVSGGKDLMCSGGVIGYAMGGASVSHITLRGENSISGYNCVGGIAGGSGATVTDCVVENVEITILGDNDFSDAQIIQEDMAECGGLVIGGAFTGTVENCTAAGTVTAEGKEAVGLGGIAGCLQCMDSITGNTANVTIYAGNAHAVGGLCGYAGIGDDGDGQINPPCEISDCNVTIAIQCDGATHVGGLVGTGLYYYGMEDCFTIENCSVTGSIEGAVTPGTVAGRAEGSSILSCDTSVTIDGAEGTELIGTTSQLYQSADQYETGSAEAEAVLLKYLAGSYKPLFATLMLPEYDQTWIDASASAVGEEQAEAMAAALKASVSAELVGQAAVDAYAADPDSMAYHCGFLQNVSEFTFDGTTFSGVNADGEEVFSHSYTSLGYNEETGFYEFQSDDPDSGEFTYFQIAPDTPATTYHIEFRYGSDLDALAQMDSGDYAYWMASGITADCDTSMIEHAIWLFCVENLVSEE